jgi:hypothetical protein
VFRVLDALPATGSDLGAPWDGTQPAALAARVPTASDPNISDPPAGADLRNAAGFLVVTTPASRPVSPAGLTTALGPATGLIAGNPTMTTPSPQQLAWPAAQPAVNTRAGWGHALASQETDEDDQHGRSRTRVRTAPIFESSLDALASALVRPRGPDPDRAGPSPAHPGIPVPRGAESGPGPTRPGGRGLAAVPAGPLPRPVVGVTDLLLVAGFCGFAGCLRAAKKRRSDSPARGERLSLPIQPSS